MGMLIRPATRSDIPAILDIYNEVVINTTASYDYEPITLDARMAWFEAHASAGYPVYVAEDEGQGVVGWSSLSEFRARIGYRFTVEDSVYIAPGYRGRGLGRQLLAPLIEQARLRGYHAIIAAIDADNVASIRLHAGFGFERVACLRQVGYKFGRWLDVVYMQLLV